MREQQMHIEILVHSVLTKLEELQYTKSVVREYRRYYDRLLCYAKSKGTVFYSEDLGREFLLEIFKHKSNPDQDYTVSKFF